MNEIKCPNCGEVFTVNESQYSELLSQVHGHLVFFSLAVAFMHLRLAQANFWFG